MGTVMRKNEESPERPWYATEPINRDKDIAMLVALLKPGSRIWPNERTAFQEMLDTFKEHPRRELSPRQRAWVTKRHAKACA